MSNDQPKPIREARAEARRIARITDATYQQALDIVARRAGHPHWASFVADNGERTVDESTPGNETIEVERLFKEITEAQETILGIVTNVIGTCYEMMDEQRRIMTDPAERMGPIRTLVEFAEPVEPSRNSRNYIRTRWMMALLSFMMGVAMVGATVALNMEMTQADRHVYGPWTWVMLSPLAGYMLAMAVALAIGAARGVRLHRIRDAAIGMA